MENEIPVFQFSTSVLVCLLSIMCDNIHIYMYTQFTCTRGTCNMCMLFQCVLYISNFSKTMVVNPHYCSVGHYSSIMKRHQKEWQHSKECVTKQSVQCTCDYQEKGHLVTTKNCDYWTDRCCTKWHICAALLHTGHNNSTQINLLLSGRESRVGVLVNLLRLFWVNTRGLHLG